MKLTIEQLRNYLGTGLEFILDYDDESYFDELVSIHKDGELSFSGDEGDVWNTETVQPLLYRLSDLDKFIPELGFVPLDKLSEIQYGMQPDSFDSVDYAKTWLEVMIREFDILDRPFWFVQKLFQWHFWVFDQSCFDEGLIIDKLKHESI